MEAISFLEDDILELEGIDSIRKEEWNYYNNNDYGVPRVSHILKQCRNSDGLIQWAANIGRRKYEYYREKALNIGSIIHEILDQYLINAYQLKIPFDVNYGEIDQEYRSSVYNCFENFKLWINRLNENGFYIEEIVGFEIPVTCPWYGGTIDGIIKINGMYYIIDFKTSKNISPEYLLQASAYMWEVNNGYAKGLPHINGIGIIRVDKNKYGVIDDLFLNESIPEQNNIICNLQKCFASYVNSFYRTINVDYISNNYHNNYDFKNVFEVQNYE